MTLPSPPPPTRRRAAGSGQAAAGSRASPTRTVTDRLSLWQQVWEKLNGEEGTGFAMSLLIHVILLALLAIPISRSLSQPEAFTTVVQRGGEDRLILDGPLDTALGFQDVAPAGDNLLQSKLFDPIDNDAAVVPQLNLGLATLGPGAGGGVGDGGEGGPGGGGGGIRIAEPKTAVRAGNFSVWSWPILSARNPDGSADLGEPGSPPKVREDYFIVIRIRIPEGRRRMNLSDLTGMVVGTDGYRQRIPDDAYFFTTRGKLTPAQVGRPVPIIDGTVEVLVRVPATDIPLIRDTITVHSNMLDEEQKLELVFQPRQ